MPVTQAVSDWGTAIWAAMAAGLVNLLGFLPNLLGAVVVLLIGWAVGAALYVVTDRLLEALRFDRAMAQTGIRDAIAKSGVDLDLEPSDLVASLVKWTVWLVAFMTAADTLRLPQVSAGIAALLAYVPNVIAAIAILTVGLLFATFVGRIVRGATASVSLRNGDLVADVAYWAITVFAVLAAIGQLNIAPALVQTLYTAVIAAVALAAAIAFGIGLRDQARDVVAGRAVAEQLHPGDEITVESTRGRIQRIGALTTQVHTAEGTVSVPNHMLVDCIIRLGGPSVRFAPAGGGGGPRSTTPPHGERPGASWRAERERGHDPRLDPLPRLDDEMP
jgi:small-conductance mechanosensitive channel